MKEFLLSALVLLLCLPNGEAQQFANKKVLIENLGASVSGNNVQNVEDVVYVKEINGALHFISHIDQALTLYKFEDNEAVEFGPIGDLSGFIVECFDHNSDGLTDILGHFQIKLGESDSSFEDETSVSSETLEGRIYRAGDYDSDGIIDILTRQVVFSGGFTETVHVYYLNSDQSIKNVESFFSGEELLGAQAFDLNQDGLYHFVYTQDIFGDNRLIIQSNNGDGTFTEQNIGVSNTETLISAGDFDNDSDLDLIITGFNGSDIEILINEDGIFSEDEKIVDAERVFSIKVADINNDTNADLIYLENNSFDSLDVNIALGNGDGSFGITRTIGQVEFNGVSFTNSFEQAAEDWLNIYDYNDDGYLDIFVSAILEQSFVVFENMGEISSVESSDNLSELSVYPNPSSDIIYIDHDQNNFKTELIDLNGTVHMTANNNSQVDLRQLNKGIYFLRIITHKQSTKMLKVIKG